MYRRGTVTGRLGGFRGSGGWRTGRGSRADRRQCAPCGPRLRALVCVPYGARVRDASHARTSALPNYVLPFDNHAIRARKKKIIKVHNDTVHDILHKYCTRVVCRGRRNVVRAVGTPVGGGGMQRPADGSRIAAATNTPLRAPSTTRPLRAPNRPAVVARIRGGVLFVV